MHIMKIYRQIITIAVFFICTAAYAQVETGGVVRKRTENSRKQKQESGVTITDRMQSFYEKNELHDADLAWMRRIYRQLDLTKEENAPLYFPEDVIDGQENLFRIILRLVVNGYVPAYEYLDGREVFTDRYKVNVREMLDRFGIYYTEGRGSNEKNPKFEIEEADVPTGQVLNYYILEKWEFDKRSNQMKTRIEAICPVLNHSGDFGEESRYPMFWVQFDNLRPWLAQQYIFISDDNNMPQYSIDDYFNMGLYNGEIYKTQNLRNLSMAQMYPDPDDMKRAQDSIDNRLRTYASNLWVPTREEYLAQKAKEEELAKANSDDTQISERENVVETNSAKKTRRVTKRKATKVKSSSSSTSVGNSNAEKSVRRRKK